MSRELPPPITDARLWELWRQADNMDTVEFNVAFGRLVAEEAVRLEREAYRELWTAAARVALSNGFDAAYPANLDALKSMIQSTRGRARSQEGQG